MTRIMYWNIETFSLNKIDSTVAPEEGDVADNGGQGIARLNLILENLQVIGGAPDIFVLVELKPGSADNAAGFVVNGAAQVSNSALTTASVEMRWTNGWSAATTFEGEFSNVTSSYAGKGVVRYAW